MVYKGQTMTMETDKLIMCPECHRIINLKNVEEIGDGAIVGCGLAEDDFMRCDDCLYTHDTDKCKYIRGSNGLSLTTARECVVVKS